MNDRGYAFLVDDPTFDAIIERIRAWGIHYWADPQQLRQGEINTNHGGRGVYFLIRSRQALHDYIDATERRVSRHCQRFDSTTPESTPA